MFCDWHICQLHLLPLIFNPFRFVTRAKNVRHCFSSKGVPNKNLCNKIFVLYIIVEHHQAEKLSVVAHSRTQLCRSLMG